MKIHKGDKVKIMVGKDKGREGVVDKVDTKRRTVVVPGVNIYKKHLRPSRQSKEGGIVETIKPLDISKVMIICKACQKPSRIGYVLEGETKKRICRKCKGEV